jgi:hypothetical protein
MSKGNGSTELSAKTFSKNKAKRNQVMEPKKTKRLPLKRDVYVEWELLESEAIKELSATAIRVLLRFMQKRTWSKVGRRGRKEVVYENKGLAFTYEEAADLDIKTDAFYRAVKKLVEVGFIDVDHQGGCYGKDYSRYSVSNRWRRYGMVDFKLVEKKRSLQQGLDVRSNIKRKMNRDQDQSLAPLISKHAITSPVRKFIWKPGLSKQTPIFHETKSPTDEAAHTGGYNGKISSDERRV